MKPGYYWNKYKSEKEWKLCKIEIAENVTFFIISYIGTSYSDEVWFKHIKSFGEFKGPIEPPL